MAHNSSKQKYKFTLFRRSAGLPGIIQTLLAADITGNLVHQTVNTLISMAKAEGVLDQARNMYI